MKRTIHQVSKRLDTFVLRNSTRRSPPYHGSVRATSPHAVAHRNFSSSTAESVIKVTRNSPTSLHAPHILDPNVAADTELVDGLLSHTRELMGHPGSIPQHIIAYSGGVDSSLVAALIHHSAQDETVRAVLGISPAVPADQVDLARHVASHIGITLIEIPTTEGDDEMYIANNGQACLACKTHLYSTLQAVANHSLADDSLTASPTSASIMSMNSTRQPQLYNGTNADDVQDPTRLGLIAASNYSVASPVRHVGKSEVRRAARHLGLPNWNYAASPCLRSRLALGVPALSEHLQRIEQAERFVRQELALEETWNLRVRLLAGNRARIEVDNEQLDRVIVELDAWNGYFCDELGFQDVSVRSFKSGSVATNETAPSEEKETENEVATSFG